MVMITCGHLWNLHQQAFTHQEWRALIKTSTGRWNCFRVRAEKIQQINTELNNWMSGHTCYNLRSMILKKSHMTNLFFQIRGSKSRTISPQKSQIVSCKLWRVPGEANRPSNWISLAARQMAPALWERSNFYVLQGNAGNQPRGNENTVS